MPRSPSPFLSQVMALAEQYRARLAVQFEDRVQGRPLWDLRAAIARATRGAAGPQPKRRYPTGHTPARVDSTFRDNWCRVGQVFEAHQGPTDEEFLDLYSQTLACGAAAFQLAQGTLRDPKIQAWLIAQANPLWQDIFRDGGLWTSEESSATLATLAAEFVRQDDSLDPVIHFYEQFLARYDARRRTKHGVFFTPRPIAAYIVAQIDRYLIEEFQLADGLADTSTWQQVLDRDRDGARSLPAGVHPDDPFVVILDPAAGTGVFLVEVVDCIHRRLMTKWEALGCTSEESRRRWNAYVPQHLLPRVFGLELLLPACVIAYLRLAIKLAETGFAFDTSATVQIHLANTIAGPPTALPLFPAESDVLLRAVEAGSATCYGLPATVIVGNPPFSGISQEAGHWIIDLLKGRVPGGRRLANYYEIDGQPLGERKAWLQDDYVKFLRFAHWKIETAGCGVIGLVTNHGYLDNPTFRGLRQQLWKTFPRITVVDLHGNRKKKEQPPEPTTDENVFGIDSGTAIGLFRRPLRNLDCASVQHVELWGAADSKLARLSDRVRPLPSQPVELRAPFYLYVPRDDRLRREYEQGYRLPDLMPVNVTAPVTARDHFVVAFTAEELAERLREFGDLSIPDDEIRRRYFTRTRSAKYAAGDTRGWKLSEARRRMAAETAWTQYIRDCWYRPFDRRTICWADWMIDWPRSDVMRHLLSAPNLAFIARRQMLPSQPCTYFWITDSLTVDGVIRSDNRGSESLFPLYLADRGPHASQRRANYSDRLLAEAGRSWKLHWLPDGRGDLHSTWGPEDLFHYCYALFFAPTYRERYADLLRSDFPRVFLAHDVALVRALCRHGEELVLRHLLRFPDAVTAYAGPTSPTGPKNMIESGYPKHDGDRVLLNPQVVFEHVPSEVWEYHVGGHQVCKKWWHDRRGRQWTAEEATCYRRIVASVQATLQVSHVIEETIIAHGGWPRAFQTG